MTVKKITYLEAVAEIEDILEKIENGDLDVDELADKVARVSFLLKLCKEKLRNTGSQVEKILNETEE